MFIAALFTAARKWNQLKCLPTDGWMNKQILVYPDNGILRSRKKEWSIHPCYSGVKPGNMKLSERNHKTPQTE